MANLQNVGGLGLHVIKYPSGRFGFVGRVPGELAYIKPSGELLTEQEFDTARHCGLGVLHLLTRTWDSRESAVEAARKLGWEVQS
jgi:hypothetical protein